MFNIKKYIGEIKASETRNSQFLHLTVNENQLSETARTFLGSKLSERYFFGGGDKTTIVDLKSFTFLGLPEIAALEIRAKQALKKMLNASVVNIHSFSGLHAMINTLISTTKPGDTVLSLRPEDGGHSATKGIIQSSGRNHAFVSFNQSALSIDVSKTVEVAKKYNARAIYIDISVYLNPVNLKELRDGVGSDMTIIYDASHTLGLILGKQFQSPLTEGADVICANTHKTFAGPQRGIIAFKNEHLGLSADTFIESTLISSVHINTLTALCITILEYEQFGKEYALQVIANSRALASEFESLNHEVRHGNNINLTDNEQVHVFIDKIGNRIPLYRNLVNNYISTNFMTVLGGRLFARLGTQEITRKGMKENDMKVVANFFDNAIRGKKLKKQVIEFTQQFNKIHFSFDNK